MMEINTDDTYCYIFKEFDENVVSDRYDWLYSMIIEFLDMEKADQYAYVSEEILRHVIIDYFVDIYRLKEFHNIELTNQIKIYAYLSYWLLRHTPIQLKENVPEEHIFINEEFVSEMIRAFLFMGFDNVPVLKESLERIDDFLGTMIYYFKYRDFSAKDIEMTILAFKAGEAYQYSVDHQS